ncbi:MAG: hypothetical protein ACTSPV_10920, partial [Candidatus Hodarchaeales archaeon]
PEKHYILIQRVFWHEIAKFFSTSSHELYSQNKSFDLREVLFNGSLQRIARSKKDNGDTRLFDLYITFLKIASKPSKKEERFTKMISLGLKILDIYLPISTNKELESIKNDLLVIRESPPELKPAKKRCI